jgi:hypothetical protein
MEVVLMIAFAARPWRPASINQTISLDCTAPA